MARSLDHSERIISYGLPGQADITGILRGGIRLEVECKTGKARQSVEQKNFQRMIESLNGVYIIIRHTTMELEKFLIHYSAK